MAKLHDMRLKLLIQQEHERISKSQPNDLDLSIVQARCLCWLALLAEAHEDQANDAEKRGDAEQAMGWFADSMRLRDVINLVTSIEIPLPDIQILSMKMTNYWMVLQFYLNSEMI